MLGLKNLRSILYALRNTSLQISRIGQTRNASSSTRPRMSTLKLSLLGVTGGVFVGTGYSVYKLNQSSAHIINEKTLLPILNEKPAIEPSRIVKYDFDNTGLKVTLYQYQTCPFCCKVRAFFDFYGISYDLIEVDPVLKQSLRWSDYRKVPTVLIQVEEGYQQLNDSTMIISALASFLNDRSQTVDEVVRFYPSISFFDEHGQRKNDIMNRYFLMFRDTIPSNRTVEDITEERKWRKWADEVLVHSLSPNVYRTWDEALQAFNWFSETGEWQKHFPAWERYLIIYVGALAMWIIGKRLKARHNLYDDVRESLYQQCNFWIKEINKKGTPFMGGAKPNLADITVFGVLSSIEGCNAFQDLLQKSKISSWYFDVKQHVASHTGRQTLS